VSAEKKSFNETSSKNMLERRTSYSNNETAITINSSKIKVYENVNEHRKKRARREKIKKSGTFLLF
jgi:hypothetical protein